MGGLLHLVQRCFSPPRPLLAVPNVTAYPSTVSVPITAWLYNGPLLCGFNVPINGLSQHEDFCTGSKVRCVAAHAVLSTLAGDRKPNTIIIIIIITIIN